MPLLGYIEQFAEDVESGRKRCTIRAFRKDGKDPRPGQTLYMYTGLRTKSCRKLLEATCKKTRQLWIDRNGMRIEVLRGSIPMKDGAIERLALNDGFKNVSDFFDFFETTHGLPFHGLLIEW